MLASLFITCRERCQKILSVSWYNCFNELDVIEFPKLYRKVWWRHCMYLNLSSFPGCVNVKWYLELHYSITLVHQPPHFTSSPVSDLLTSLSPMRPSLFVIFERFPNSSVTPIFSDGIKADKISRTLISKVNYFTALTCLTSASFSYFQDSSPFVQ